jgi:hypothetical protein
MSVLKRKREAAAERQPDDVRAIETKSVDESG